MSAREDVALFSATVTRGARRDIAEALFGVTLTSPMIGTGPAQERPEES
jgi:hypothetical protein